MMTGNFTTPYAFAKKAAGSSTGSRNPKTVPESNDSSTNTYVVRAMMAVKNK